MCLEETVKMKSGVRKTRMFMRSPQTEEAEVMKETRNKKVETKVKA